MPTDMEIDTIVDMDDVKKCLIDAGLYEENMNDEEMRTYYDAIKSSVNTFEEDTHNRSEVTVSSDVEKGTPEEDLQVDDVMQSLQESKEINVTIVNVDSVNFDPMNCSPIKHKPLDVIYHKPRYSLAPHVDPALSKMPIEEKTRIVLAFHKRLLQEFYEAHKKSKARAPLGRAIQSSERFNGTLDRKTPTNSYDFTEESQPESTYVLRSGRQTKRKVYIDPYESDNEKKKSKKEEEKEKEEYRPSVSKRQASAPKTNQEIMKRSRFFTDTTPKSSRTEKIFDQLVASEKKRQKDAEKTDKFNASLAKISDDEDVVPSSQPAVPANDEVLIIEDAKTAEPPYIKRRVPPPLRGRRGIGPRGRGGSSSFDADKSKLLQSPPTKSPSPQSPSVSFVKSEARPSVSYTSTPEPKQKANTKGKTKCPICSDLFHTDEIEAHASNCGLGMENSVTFDSIVGNGQNIKCNVCDKEMPMTTDYEAHVHECMRKVRYK